MTAPSLTALRCGLELDAGDVYLKLPLSLHGTAEEIFLRADSLIEQMIEYIVLKDLWLYRNRASQWIFSRRTPAQSNLTSCSEGDLSAWYDFIRMLDAEDYPHAFVEVHGMRLSSVASTVVVMDSTLT